MTTKKTESVDAANTAATMTMPDNATPIVADLTAPITQHSISTPVDAQVMPGFGSQSGWELAQRIGKAFASSTLVPKAYQGNVANCIVALEMANRMGASPLMVMQNLYLVHGNPGWSSKFLIASFNQCGRFTSLRYEWNDQRTSCRAWATEKATGERIDGPTVTLDMAKAEGWSTKDGSKWKTMPELMMMYRSAAFLIRTYAPEISMGLQTSEELHDVAQAQPERRVIPAGEKVRLTAAQFAQLHTAVKQGVVSMEEVAERHPNLVADQFDTLTAAAPAEHAAE